MNSEKEMEKKIQLRDFAHTLSFLAICIGMITISFIFYPGKDFCGSEKILETRENMSERFYDIGILIIPFIGGMFVLDYLR
jgi:hypothetical protein